LTPGSNAGSNKGTAYGDPIFTPANNFVGGGNFKITEWPSDYWSCKGTPCGSSTAAPHFPNEGILGQPDYTGTGWTAEVDFVNLYFNDTVTPLYNYGQAAKADGYFQNFYPAVPALLMGESYHIIPGTQAKSKISLTEDALTDTAFQGEHFRNNGVKAKSMAINHLGPYSQEAFGPSPMPP